MEQKIRESNEISMVNTLYYIISEPAPLPYSYSIIFYNNLSTYSGLLSKSSIINVKSNANKYNLESSDTSVEENNKVEDTYINPVEKAKHFPPANKEWINSTYVYNKTVKDLPILDKTLSKLIRSYFNLYNNKLRTKIRKHGSRRFEIRKSRRLMNKIFIGKPELKHNNDNVVITVYLYNLEKKYLINKIKKIPAVYKINPLGKYNTLKKQKKLAIKKINRAKTLYLRKTNKVSISIRSKLNSHKKNFFILKKVRASHHNVVNINRYNKHFMKSYIRKFLRKEVISIFYKQMLNFNKSKFEKKYVIHLANNVAKMYNKKVEFNFVSLKHIYLDSQIFSMGLVTKLKRLARMKKSFLKGLKQFLSMFRIPRISTLRTYNDIFNRQIISQNINNNNVLEKLNYNGKQDIIDNTLNFSKFISKTNISKFKALTAVHHTSTLTQAFNSIKYKIINGVRLEIAGRFTKRSSAARSVFKIRNKGSIKNKDSSYKGLPAVFLKGYAKSNLQYNKVCNKVRGGSFGIKGWLSGA